MSPRLSADALTAARERLTLAHRNYRELIHTLTPAQLRKAEARIEVMEKHFKKLEQERAGRVGEVTADDILRGAKRR